MKMMLHGRLVHVGKTLTDLQILGCEKKCELHQNAFGGRAGFARTAGGYSSPKPSIAFIRGREGRKDLGIGREEKRVEKVVGREGKGVGRSGRDEKGREEHVSPSHYNVRPPEVAS